MFKQADSLGWLSCFKVLMFLLCNYSVMHLVNLLCENCYVNTFYIFFQKKKKNLLWNRSEWNFQNANNGPRIRSCSGFRRDSWGVYVILYYYYLHTHTHIHTHCYVYCYVIHMVEVITEYPGALACWNQICKQSKLHLKLCMTKCWHPDKTLPHKACIKLATDNEKPPSDSCAFSLLFCHFNHTL